MQKLPLILFIVLSSFILIVFIGGIFLFITQYRKRRVEYEREKSLLREKHQLQLLQTELTSQQQTMQQIGREIHDNVGQKLTLASLYTQQLAYENKAPQINDKIENIGNIINESLAELRQLSKSLTDDTISNSNIYMLLAQECNRINELKKCHVSFSCAHKNVVLSYQIKNILLRIVQEFLQNSIKHTQCKNIDVNLNTDEKYLYLKLTDDGKGFDVKKITSKGIGLANMKTRAELIGGVYSIDSNPGIGTKLSIAIPL
jgi:signal transduction histidine kinase